MKKTCSQCKKDKDLDEFHRHPICKHGRNSKCKECRLSYMKVLVDNRTAEEKHKRYLQSKDKICKRSREYYQKNRKNKIKWQAEYQENRKKTDPEFKMRVSLRNRISSAIRRAEATKSDRTIALTGCSMKFLREYLESKFEQGMTWENYGLYGWHIDHIIPCVNFDLTKPEDQKKCFHYTNLQPLWAKDNLRKGAR